MVGPSNSGRWVEVEEAGDDEPRYLITAVASRAGIHVQTVRRYEAFGLVAGRRSEQGLALYSEADIARIQRIRRLTDDLGVNLAGAAAVLHLREQVIALKRELADLQRALSDR